MGFNIDSIGYELGECQVDLSKAIVDFERTFEKTGIAKVFRTEKKTFELGVCAAERALETSSIKKEDIRFLIYVTQSQSRFLPGDGVLVHSKLGLSSSVLVYDINAGCSGFAQGLFLATHLVDSLGAGIIVCSDAYRSKLDPLDRSTNAVFSDAGSAVIISPGNSFNVFLKSFSIESENGPDYLSQDYNGGFLKMNGPALWAYTRSKVVLQINSMIERSMAAGKLPSTIYLHQASQLVVDGISSHLSLAPMHVPTNYQSVGNCVSSSIPILLKENFDLFRSKISILAGFGVGIMSVCLGIEGNE